MFTKKPLANCASCEKSIHNLLTNGADHQNWNRLPFREPNERIARYAQGFSKILQTMKNSESATQIRGDHSAMDMEEQRTLEPQHSQRFSKRSPSVNVEQEASRHAITNQNLEKFQSSTLSPSVGRNNNYSSTMPGEDVSTQDMSRVNAYKSATKMRMSKKGQSPQPLKPMVNTTWDAPNDSTLPNVRGAKRASIM